MGSLLPLISPCSVDFCGQWTLFWPVTTDHPPGLVRGARGASVTTRTEPTGASFVPIRAHWRPLAPPTDMACGQPLKLPGGLKPNKEWPDPRAQGLFFCGHSALHGWLAGWLAGAANWYSEPAPPLAELPAAPLPGLFFQGEATADSVQSGPVHSLSCFQLTLQKAEIRSNFCFVGNLLSLAAQSRHCIA